MQALKLVEDRETKKPASAVQCLDGGSPKRGLLLVGKGGFYGNVFALSRREYWKADVDEARGFWVRVSRF